MDRHKILDTRNFKRVDKDPKELEEELDKLSIEGWNFAGSFEERFLVFAKEIEVEEKETEIVDLRKK